MHYALTSAAASRLRIAELEAQLDDLRTSRVSDFEEVCEWERAYLSALLTEERERLARAS